MGEGMSMRSFRALQSFDRWKSRFKRPHSSRSEPTYGVARALCPACGLEQRVPRWKLNKGMVTCRVCKAGLGKASSEVRGVDGFGVTCREVGARDQAKGPSQDQYRKRQCETQSWSVGSAHEPGLSHSRSQGQRSAQ